MIIKAVTLLLVFFAILALFGRWRFPGADKLRNAQCTNCGRFRIGKGPCACGKE